MKATDITTGPNPNNGVSLYLDGQFVGMFSRYGNDADIVQTSGISGHIFNEMLCVDYMKLQFPKRKIYAHTGWNGNQWFLNVSTRRLLRTEGEVREY